MLGEIMLQLKPENLERYAAYLGVMTSSDGRFLNPRGFLMEAHNCGMLGSHASTLDFGMRLPKSEQCLRCSRPDFSGDVSSRLSARTHVT